MIINGHWGAHFAMKLLEPPFIFKHFVSADLIQFWIVFYYNLLWFFYEILSDTTFIAVSGSAMCERCSFHQTLSTIHWIEISNSFKLVIGFVGTNELYCCSVERYLLQCVGVSVPSCVHNLHLFTTQILRCDAANSVGKCKSPKWRTQTIHVYTTKQYISTASIALQ